MASSFEPLFAPAPAQGSASGPAWMALLSQRGGFSSAGFAARPHQPEPPPQPEPDAALAEAFAQGEAHGRAMAEAAFIETEEARAALTLSLAQLDEGMERELAQRLAECVAALCEATLAPLALDREALERRCVRAAGMVGEGITDASLRLHPDDVRLLDPGFASTWHILPDPMLERGSVVFDTAEGAVVDGPAEWRAALREALGLC
ncbi:flagellar biosynthesis protein [Altererythrobacter lauratis]|uniref:Flagellar biosynthesis protein n=1 Tax=Alteraurantiacibacter lauratis TaxID=2054627 RepID=A0ABV7EDT0_9SPHN